MILPDLLFKSTSSIALSRPNRPNRRNRPFLLTYFLSHPAPHHPKSWGLKGDMSFVGPRPALFNQDDLIALRTKKGVHRLMPGITPVK